jgi:hypothetical protein
MTSLVVLLEEFVLERHVRLGLKTNAGAEDVGESTTLLGQSVDNRSPWGGQGCLETLAKINNASEDLLP